MTRPAINPKGCEWQAEWLAGEIIALLNEIQYRQEQVEILAFHRAGFPPIHKESVIQAQAIDKLLGIYKDATAHIMAVITDMTIDEAKKVITDSNNKQ